MKNSDMPAMPLPDYAMQEVVQIDGADEGVTTTKYVTALGLTKREHFASMALQIAGAEYIDGLGITYGPTEGWERYIAERSVNLADALLAALENRDD